MAAYYNEFDAYAAQWLRNLIAPGDVDERSITEVSFELRRLHRRQRSSDDEPK